ncbi:hypothetical protein Hanom_Chr01g00052071 [Helianthus anomalus]
MYFTTYQIFPHLTFFRPRKITMHNGIIDGIIIRDKSLIYLLKPKLVLAAIASILVLLNPNPVPSPYHAI